MDIVGNRFKKCGCGMFRKFPIASLSRVRLCNCPIPPTETPMPEKKLIKKKKQCAVVYRLKLCLVWIRDRVNPDLPINRSATNKYIIQSNTL